MLCGLILKFQFFFRAKDLAKSIPLEKLNSDGVAQFIVNEIHRSDQLSAVSEVFIYLMVLLSTRIHHGENVKNIDSRSSSPLSRFRSHGNGGIYENCWHLF